MGGSVRSSGGLSATDWRPASAPVRAFGATRFFDFVAARKSKNREICFWSVAIDGRIR
jgi:hypothetical protein